MAIKDVEFVLATANDIPLLVDYRMQFLEEVYGIQPPDKVAQVRKQIQEFLNEKIKDKTCICWLATLRQDQDDTNRKVIAMGIMVLWEQLATFTTPAGKMGYIMNMYTLPEYRNQGLSSAILKKLEETAGELGVNALELHATSIGEPVYRKRGFDDPEMISLYKEF